VDHIGWTPAQLTGGIAVKPFQGFSLSADLTWKEYSAFTFFWDMPPFDRDESGMKYKYPFNDVWVPRVGLEYAFDPGLKKKWIRKLREISFRSGYYWEPTPVPEMSGPMNILDSDKHVVSGGIGFVYDADWTGLVKLDTFFQVHLLKDNYIPNDRDPLFPGVTVGGQVWNMGISLAIVY
jgi:long-subunit fatty acid transport protein